MRNIAISKMRNLTWSITEFTLIGIYFASLLLIILVGGSFATILWLVSLLGLIILYIVRSDDLLYSIALGLTILLAIGIFYRINYLPGADLMLAIGLSTQIVMPILLIRSAIIHKEKIDAYYWLIYVLAGLLIIQFLPFIDRTSVFSMFITYVILSASIWIFWRNPKPITFIGFHSALRMIILIHSTSMILHISTWIGQNTAHNIGYVAIP